MGAKGPKGVPHNPGEVAGKLGLTSRLGSVVAGSPARTAAMIRRDFKARLRRFLRGLHGLDPGLRQRKKSPASLLKRGQ